MRYLVLVSIVTLLTLAMITNAFHQHKQFYPTVIYLYKSNVCFALIYFIVCNILWLFGYILVQILFGEIRSTESEELWEKVKFVATETLMSFAVFKDSFGPHFAMMFAMLIYVKIVHWLGEERVDYLERSPVIPKLFHARMLSTLVLLIIVDVTFIVTAFAPTDLFGYWPHVAFGFEYAILLPSILFIILKYILHVTEINQQEPLEDKALILLFGQLTTDTARLFLYLSYLGAMVQLYMLPVFAFRQVFSTMKNLVSSIKDVLAFKKAVQYMRLHCPTATQEDLAATDSVCIVCRESMTVGAKKLPCNHICHGSCLRSWFQRQQTCPTCRLKILEIGVNETIYHEIRENRRIVPRSKAFSRRLVRSNRDKTKTQDSHVSDNQSNSESQPSQSSSLSTDQQVSSSFTASNNHTQEKGTSTTYDVVKASTAFLESNISKQDNETEHESLSHHSRQGLLENEKNISEDVQRRIKSLTGMSTIIKSTICILRRYYQRSSKASNNTRLSVSTGLVDGAGSSDSTSTDKQDESYKSSSSLALDQDINN